MQNFIVGNWKMNQLSEDIKTFFKTLEENRQELKDKNAWVAPQHIHFPLVREIATKLGIKTGAQNCSHQEKGAFTGDISPAALKDLGCDFVITGHSERRTIFKEPDEIINQKNRLALKNNLEVIFCVGETLEEREAGRAEEVVKKQIFEGLKGISATEMKKMMIAYEPVWAIGTGKTATPLQAQEMHAFARTLLKELQYPETKIPILYGGSVNPGNVAELMSQTDINGALVGGASLKAHDFIKLCEAS